MYNTFFLRQAQMRGQEVGLLYLGHEWNTLDMSGSSHLTIGYLYGKGVHKWEGPLVVGLPPSSLGPPIQGRPTNRGSPFVIPLCPPSSRLLSMRKKPGMFGNSGNKTLYHPQ
jgi:hypothetical protein